MLLGPQFFTAKGRNRRTFACQAPVNYDLTRPDQAGGRPSVSMTIFLIKINFPIEPEWWPYGELFFVFNFPPFVIPIHFHAATNPFDVIHIGTILIETKSEANNKIATAYVRARICSTSDQLLPIASFYMISFWLFSGQIAICRREWDSFIESGGQWQMSIWSIEVV